MQTQTVTRTSQPTPTADTSPYIVWSVEIEVDYGTVLAVGPFASRYEALSYYCTASMQDGVTECETVKYTFSTRYAANQFADTLASPDEVA